MLRQTACLTDALLLRLDSESRWSGPVRTEASRDGRFAESLHLLRQPHYRLHPHQPLQGLTVQQAHPAARVGPTAQAGHLCRICGGPCGTASSRLQCHLHVHQAVLDAHDRATGGNAQSRPRSHNAVAHEVLKVEHLTSRQAHPQMPTHALTYVQASYR